MKKRAVQNGERLTLGDGDYRHLDIPVPDIGLMGIDGGDTDCPDLFDYFGEDDNTRTRYTRPRPAVMPSACVRYENAEQLAHDLPMTSGMRYDAFVAGNFFFGDFIEAFLRVNNARAETMTVATLSMNQENVDSLNLLMEKGFIGELRLMVSDYFYAHSRRDMVPYIYKMLDIEERFQMGVARIHTKTVHFETAGGKKIIIHGSANLRANGCIEQMTIEENPTLYDFYEETYDLLFERFSTINHKVSDRATFAELEKRLTSK